MNDLSTRLLEASNDAELQAALHSFQADHGKFRDGLSDGHSFYFSSNLVGATADARLEPGMNHVIDAFLEPAPCSTM